jgi:predicted transcriptional regulator
MELKFYDWERVLIHLAEEEKKRDYSDQSRENIFFQSKVARVLDITYSHVITIMELLRKKGLVVSTLDGRKRVLSLTDKGKEVGYAYLKISEVLEI